MAYRSVQVVFCVLMTWSFSKVVERSSGLRIGPSFIAEIRVLGSVFCDSCLENRFTKNSILLSDAKAVLECRNKDGRLEPHGVAATNEKGEFMMEFRQNSSKISIQDCSTRIILGRKAKQCEIASTSQALSLQAIRGGIVTYNVDPFICKPKRPLSFCASDFKPLKALSLGPPDPPHPLLSTNGYQKVVTKSYHLGPPDPPQPFSSADKKGSYHWSPPHGH